MGLTKQKPGVDVRSYDQGDSGGYGQIVAVSAIKDGAAAAVRLGVTAADVGGGPAYDPATATQIAVKDAPYVTVAADCDGGGKLISLILAYWDADNTLIGVSNGFGFTSSIEILSNGRYPCYGSPTVLDVTGVAKAAVIVTDLTAGSSWNIRLRPCY